MWLSNPYRSSVILQYEEPEISLERNRFNYVKSVNDQIHTVRYYDNLSDLSFDYYGDSKWYWVIADTNNLENPFELPAPGSNLIIPDLNPYKLVVS